jgi:exodeoxyribonuclease V alpha subunit
VPPASSGTFGSDLVKGIGPILAKKLVAIRFDDRVVKYDFGELDEVSLAYAVAIHKSQGSEFPAVVIPLATQHYMLLQRNLIYARMTRGKRLLVLVGQKKALRIAVCNDRLLRRYSGLLSSLRSDRQRRVVSCKGCRQRVESV